MNSNQKNNYEDLACHFKSKESRPNNFSAFDHALGFLRKIRNCDTTLKEAKKNKKEFKADLNVMVSNV